MANTNLTQKKKPSEKYCLPNQSPSRFGQFYPFADQQNLQSATNHQPIFLPNPSLPSKPAISLSFNIHLDACQKRHQK